MTDQLNAKLRLPGRLQTAETMRTKYVHVLRDQEMTLETIQHPDFWRNAGRQLKPGDRIEVLSADGTWCAELLVRSASQAEVIVGLVFHKDFGETVKPAPAIATELTTKWRGPGAKWSVMRPDGEVMRDKFDTEDQAKTYIQNHERSKAA